MAGGAPDVAGWDSKETSAVPWSVYLAIATYLLSYDVTYWLMFLLQWNLMSRSVDITRININSFSFDNDMLTILYTHRKTERKKSTSKPKTVHIASNPSNPIICCVLGFYLNTQMLYHVVPTELNPQLKVQQNKKPTMHFH